MLVQIALLILPFTVAVPATVGRDVSRSLIGKVVCPRGQTLFEVTNAVTVPDTTPAEVWSYLGDFCNVTWQGFDLISTKGRCNTPGSTRTFSTLGLTLTEKLDLNVGSASSPAPRQKVFIQAFELLGNPQLDGASVTDVHDLLTVSKDGSSTAVNWEVVGCSNDTTVAEAVFSEVHGAALAGTVAYFA